MTDDLTTAHRRLRISILKEPESAHRAVEILTALPGLTEAKSDTANKWIRVSYDVTKLHYPALIKALEEQGLLNKLGWWERVKSDWYSDQDCVARDNARAKPSPCCSNPTSIMAQTGKKKRH